MMPIQRQSDQFAAFDDGPRWARDRAPRDLPAGLAALVNTSGPRIQAGLLDTRQAGVPMDSPHGLPGPRDHGGHGPDGGPSVPDWYWDDDEDEGHDDGGDDPGPGDDPERFIPERLVEGRRGSGRRPFDRTAGSGDCDWCYGHKPTSQWLNGLNVCRDCEDTLPKADYQRFVDENHGGRQNRRAVDQYARENGLSLDEKDNLWDWADHLQKVQEQGHAAHDLERAWRSDLENNRWGLDRLIHPERWEDDPHREASRRPFDRAAARRQAKDGGCECWDGYERVPGTEPCAEGSCRRRRERREGSLRGGSILTYDWNNEKYEGKDGEDFPEGHWRARLENGHHLNAYRVQQALGSRPEGWAWSIYTPIEGDPQGAMTMAEGGGHRHGEEIASREEAMRRAEEAYERSFLPERMRGGGRAAEPPARRDDLDDDFGYIFGALRLAGDGMSWEDTLRHIDETLAEGEGHKLHRVPGVDHLEPEHPGYLTSMPDSYYDHSDIFDHCRACGGDGRDDLHGGDCEGCGGTGENQGDPYGNCDGCGEEFGVEDLQGEADMGAYCPACARHRTARLAGWADDNPAFDDIMKHIDEQLAAGERDNNRDVFRDPRFDGDNGHRPDRDRELAERGFSTGPGDVMRVAWEGKACPDCAMALANADDSGASPGWSWDAMQSGINSLPGDGDVHLDCGEDDDCDSNFQRGPCDLCGNPDSGTFHPVVTLERNHRHAALPVQPPVVGAHGFQPAHRVGLPWRDTVIPGTVIGLDGPNVAVRWDDGQYSTEEPHNINLL